MTNRLPTSQGEPEIPPTPFGLDWVRIVRSARADDVLAAVSEATGCSLRFALPLSSHAPPVGARSAFENREVEATGPCSTEERERALRLALEALRGWAAARAEVRRASVRATEQGLDADALQDLAQRLAVVRNAAELVSVTAEVLHRRIGLDACGVVGVLEDPPVVPFAVFRRGVQSLLPALVRRVSCGPGGANRDDLPISTVPAVHFDSSLPSRTGLGREDSIFEPIPARVDGGAVLTVLPTAEPDQRARRIVRGVAALLALHVERMAASAKEEEVRFRAILDAMPQAVWLLDSNLRVVRSNRSADVGFSELDWTAGKRVENLGTFRLSAAVTDVLDGKDGASDSDVRYGGGRVLSVTVSPFQDVAGRPRGAVVVIDDVSESRRLQSRMAQAERMSSLGRMLSGVAHELNNPLATVIGFAEMARAAPSAPGIEKRLRLIHDEANRCRRIVGNLLRFARRQEPERKAVVLNELVESTLGLLSYALRVDGIRLETDLDRSVPAIPADPHELQQVLINLVTNAHHAIRATGRPGVVRVRTARDVEGAILMEVLDDGPGIPDELIGRVFDPFFTTKPLGDGTGLGLSLVYGTVKAHGGTVEAANRTDGGCVIRIRLPIGRSVSTASAEGHDQPSPTELAGARVLVVDDEPGVSLLITETLTDRGCHAVAANDAETVRRLLESDEFDLVVCDLKMAGLGAERLHGLLETGGQGLERGIVLTTGDSVSLDAETLATAIGASLVHKPFALETLVDAVRRGLGRRRHV